MRQIVYVSESLIVGEEAELSVIFDQSRHNNAIDGVSGLLCFDGQRFLQAIEGPDESVAATFDRIRTDPRHHNLTVVIDRSIGRREFGTWVMARHRAGETSPFGDNIKRSLSHVAAEVGRPFLDMLGADADQGKRPL